MAGLVACANALGHIGLADDLEISSASTCSTSSCCLSWAERMSKPSPNVADGSTTTFGPTSPIISATAGRRLRTRRLRSSSSASSWAAGSGDDSPTSTHFASRRADRAAAGRRASTSALRVSDGGAPIAHRLEPSERLPALLAKLKEETDELRDASRTEHRLEELADVYEVLQSLAAELGLPWSEVEVVAAAKREARGSFTDGIWLELGPPADDIRGWSQDTADEPGEFWP